MRIIKVEGLNVIIKSGYMRYKGWAGIVNVTGSQNGAMLIIESEVRIAARKLVSSWKYIQSLRHALSVICCPSMRGNSGETSYIDLNGNPPFGLSLGRATRYV